MPTEQPCLILLGFMGSGKSSVARRLASWLHLRRVDLDHEIEAKAGCSVAEYFSRHGEASFRELEAEVLGLALAQTCIVSTGGGIVTQPANRNALKRAARQGALVIYLKADAVTLARRIRRQPGTRPLIDSDAPLSMAATIERVEELLRQRGPFYEDCANLTVESEGRRLDNIVEQVREAYLQHCGEGLV